MAKLGISKNSKATKAKSTAATRVQAKGSGKVKASTRSKTAKPSKRAKVAVRAQPIDKKSAVKRKVTPVKKAAKAVAKPVRSVKTTPKRTTAAKPSAALKRTAVVKEIAKPLSRSVKAIVKKVAAQPKRRGVQRSKSAENRPTTSVPNKLHFRSIRLPTPKRRPIAHIQPPVFDSQSADKTRYSPEELKEFEALIHEKLASARAEFKSLKEALNRGGEDSTEGTLGVHAKVLEDGAETAEKENLNQLAARQLKYVNNLENALIRIKSGNYGVCSVTGKLIPKERLIAVPHTTQSIEAKLMRRD